MAADGGMDGGRDGGVRRLHVFVFPAELVFYSEDSRSQRRVLTLYNPYGCTLTYKVWCTAPSLYSVTEAEGSVRSRSCVDIVVRQRDVSRRLWGQRSRFRLDIWGPGGQRGSREVGAELREGQESFRGANLPPPTPLPPSNTARVFYCPTTGGSVTQSVVLVLVSVVCVVVLMLPLHTEPSTLLPPHTHVTLTHKLVCAYTLGLLTVVFLR
ncbi:motile sperm domain-containing protein 1-like [Colossoma macropomum]|uniref:motile sperm domain-containing protein 1-like n=1 Tax=Colossoma macropomum TaxID=42526 RepID=UPI0018646F6B|nr:motile sperm domain-containing protein 1-like [Colossoma macropomum]